MPPTTWDVPTFEQQQHDIDEIDTALPTLDARRSALLKRQAELNALLTCVDRRSSDGSHLSNDSHESQISHQEAVAELRDMNSELEDIALQRRGRLMLAKGCEEANRKMLDDVSVEFLTKGEKEQLGALRLKLSRILFQYGD